MAHEIGHACGLSDIYAEKGGMDVGGDLVKEQWMPQDFNSGPSPEYYNRSLEHKTVIRGLLMFGTTQDIQISADIPMGNVYGIARSSNGYTNCMVKVGLDNGGYPMNRSPVSN